MTLDINNATESTIIGGVITFLIKFIMPWTLHTIATIITAIIAAFCVYLFNKWLKDRDDKKKIELELERKKKIDSINTMI